MTREIICITDRASDANDTYRMRRSLTMALPEGAVGAHIYKDGHKVAP